MKRFIDEVFVRNYDLAYTIARGLEKDVEFSTVIFDTEGDPLERGRVPGFCIKIFREDKLACGTPIGYGTVANDPDRSLDIPVADC